MSENQGPQNSGIIRNAPVVVYLHSPREKLWGLIGEINSAGIFMRGIDLNSFDDWTRMLAKGERNIGLTHLFYPMWRVERVTLDERIDDIPSMAEQFQERVGLTIDEYFIK
jgi:hypothetical protein